MQQPTSVHPLKPARCTPTVGGARSRRDPAQAGGAERCAQGLALHGRGQWGQALSVFAGAVGDELASGLTGARRAACAARAACAPRSPRRPRACDARGGDARRYTVGRVLLEPRTAMADGVTVCVCVCVCVCVLLLCAPRTPCRDMAAANLEVAVDCIFGAALSLNTLGQKEDSLGDRAAGIDVTRVGPAS